MLTKNHNPRVMLWAAGFAMVLAFVGKFGAALQTIPVPVMGAFSACCSAPSRWWG